jgi:crossover junction endodeoxyribonuclease RusA
VTTRDEWAFVGELRIRGLPVAQSRPRAYVRPSGKGGVYDDGKSRGWKSEVIGEAMRSKLPRGITGPIRLFVSFEMPRPKRLKEAQASPHVNVPDLDNLLKAVMDALSEYGVWKDDRQVVEFSASKWYHRDGGEPHALVVIDKARE